MSALLLAVTSVTQMSSIPCESCPFHLLTLSPSSSSNSDESTAPAAPFSSISDPSRIFRKLFMLLGLVQARSGMCISECSSRSHNMILLSISKWFWRRQL